VATPKREPARHTASPLDLADYQRDAVLLSEAVEKVEDASQALGRICVVYGSVHLHDGDSIVLQKLIDRAHDRIGGLCGDMGPLLRSIRTVLSTRWRVHSGC
jgi:hypothetical protein